MKTNCENVLHKELNYQVKPRVASKFQGTRFPPGDSQESTNQAVNQHAPTKSHKQPSCVGKSKVNMTCEYT